MEKLAAEKEKECVDYLNGALTLAGSALNYSSLQSLADDIARIETQVNTLKNRSIQFEITVGLPGPNIALPDSAAYFAAVSQPTGTRITAVEVIQQARVTEGTIQWRLTSLSSVVQGSVTTLIVDHGTASATAQTGTFTQQAVACEAGQTISLELLLASTIVGFTHNQIVKITLSYN